MISELRETRKESGHVKQRQQQVDNGNPPTSPAYAPTPGLLTPELMESCVDVFFTHMYPMMPILDPDQLQGIMAESSSSLEAYCLISAFCAFMLIQPGVAVKVIHVVDQPTESVTDPHMGQALMDEATRVRKGLDYVENPTMKSVITSFFLFRCGFGLTRHNTSWNHLREATAQALNLSMQDAQTYLFGDAVENSRKRRLFWLLFVTER